MVWYPALRAKAMISLTIWRPMPRLRLARLGDRAVQAACMRNPHFIRGMALCEADLMDDAALVSRDAATESERPGQAWLLPDVQLASTELRFLLGQWEQAAPDPEGGIKSGREPGNLSLLPKVRGYVTLIAVAPGERPRSALSAPRKPGSGASSRAFPER
jgi:hypothetical protein